MKISKPALIALLLWVVTIAVFGWFFIHGKTAVGTDGRTAVVLQASERDLVLSEMRGMLAATQGVLEGANQGDMQGIIKAASAAPAPEILKMLSNTLTKCVACHSTWQLKAEN